MGEIPELLTRRTRSEGWLKRGRERGLITGVLLASTSVLMWHRRRTGGLVR